MVDKRFIVGIDLGTTNSAVSYVDLENGERLPAGIHLFAIPQLNAPGEVLAQDILPSFLYLPGGHEIDPEAVRLPWHTPAAEGLVGVFAREQGARVPKRLVSSAKSWLCHGRVDRRAAVLPWGVDEGLPRVSPVAATAAYLRHVREAWNHRWDYDEALLLEGQNVVVTVPASFDEVARDLTVEAAESAGIPKFLLLEEPLAVFYSWLVRHENDWHERVRPGELVLVCDVGGGTTDFTLITLREKEGVPEFERIAVGDHLILGGDNMDLALARIAEGRMQRGGRAAPLQLHRWQALCHQCRSAKEEILSGDAPSRSITLVGEGRRVIGGTLSTSLDREEIERVILDGFFPLVDPDEDLREPQRRGMTELGLPYAQDPAITRHLIRFLERHREDIARASGRETPYPDLILFNGGALKPAIIRDRIRQAVRCRFSLTDEGAPRVLENPHLDLAVAIGASYYGLVKVGRGVRVGSGSPRAYYLGLGTAGRAEKDTEGGKAICLIERGMHEGADIRVPDRRFEVLANQPVHFQLFSSSFRSGDHIGDVIEVDETLTALPPIRTVIQFGKKARETAIPVQVEASYTEMGTLAIWCRSLLTEHRWRLQFQLREAEAAVPVADHAFLEESVVEGALSVIEETFTGTGQGPAPERLVKTLEEQIGKSKDRWPLSVIRRFADALMECPDARERSSEVESRWLNLLGFCLRPGFGDALDEHRLQKIWRLYNRGPLHTNHPQVRPEWWCLWRRVAGGLSVAQQRQVGIDFAALVRPKKKKDQKKLPPQEHLELWMALANMERLPAADKELWARILLEGFNPKSVKPQYWWALARITAREPLYGPVDRVVPPRAVAAMVDTILATDWRNPKPVGAALAQMGRLTGDRTRDLDPEVIARMVAWLEPHEWAHEWIRCLREVVPVAEQEEEALFGEALPAGIRLHQG